MLVDDFLINKFAATSCSAFLALALALSWGYGGILNLGQALEFGLGSYCMAMALKLRTVPVQTGVGGLPDFMVWNNVSRCPGSGSRSIRWLRARRRHRRASALVAALGWFMFRGRVTGVYVAIITLAMLVVLNLLIIDQQQLHRRFQRHHRPRAVEIGGIVFDAYGRTTFYLVATSAVSALLFGYVLTRTKTGLILQAIRDHEGACSISAMTSPAYKISVLAISAAIAGSGRHALHDRDGVRVADIPRRASQPVGGDLVCGRRPRQPARSLRRRGAGHRRAGSAVGIAAFLDTWTLVMGACSCWSFCSCRTASPV